MDPKWPFQTLHVYNERIYVGKRFLHKNLKISKFEFKLKYYNHKVWKYFEDMKLQFKKAHYFE